MNAREIIRRGIGLMQDMARTALAGWNGIRTGNRGVAPVPASAYVEPTITFYDRFADCLQADDDYSRYWNKTEFGDIFGKKRLVVLAEPGYGKTRMLKEIVIRGASFGKKGVYIDLLGGAASASIEDYLRTSVHKAVSSLSLDTEEKIAESRCIVTDGFVLRNSDDTVICFDALDEVQAGEPFSSIVCELRAFAAQWDKVSVVVSCRTHHFRRHESGVSMDGFTFCVISDFGEDRIRTFLNERTAMVNVDRVLKHLSHAHSVNILRTPRYLAMFVQLLETNGVDDVLRLNRTDLFEKFIYGKLARETTENIDVIKRVLEKLALVMEVFQANTLTKDDFLTCLDRIDSHLSTALLHSSGYRALLDKSLVKDNLDHIQFENTEFQEYLAAKELTRMAKNDQVLYDMVVDAQLREVMPSWFNTLSFLVELDISRVRPLLELGRHRPDAVQDNEFHKLLTVVRTDRLDASLRQEIFDWSFGYYQKELIWLDYDVAERLAFYCVSASVAKLLEPLTPGERSEDASRIRGVNAVRLISCLFRYKLLPDERNSLKDRLADLVQSSNKSLQDEIILALGDYGDFAVIEELAPHLDTSRRFDLERLIRTLEKVRPNSDLALRYFVEGTRRRLLPSRDGLYSITDAGLIAKLIAMLVTDDDLLRGLLYLEDIYKESEEQLIANIRSVVNGAILDAAEDLAFAVCSRNDLHDAYKSAYIRGVLQVLRDKRPDALLSIIARMNEQKIDPCRAWQFDECAKLLLTEANAEPFIKEIVAAPNGRQFAFYLFSSYGPNSPLDALGRKYLAAEYKQNAKGREEYERRHRGDDIGAVTNYDRFKKKLGSDDGWYMEVFDFYSQNRTELQGLLVPQDIQLLKDRVFTVLRDDPLKTEVKASEGSGGARSYTTSWHSHVFHKCLRIAVDFGWDVAGVRQNIVNSIPFAYSSSLDLIFGCIPDVSQEELNPVMAVYTQRQDDLAYFMPEGFLDACERYHLTKAVPILDRFVNDNRMLVQNRRGALKTRTVLCFPTGETFLRSVFNEYQSTLPDLAIAANELLIEKFSADDAIAWRISEIERRAFKCVQDHDQDGPRSISHEEAELHSRTFARSLLCVNDVRYLDKYIALLDFSFAKVREHQEYYPYANYIWDIVCAYFLGLRVYRRYEYIQELERHIYACAGTGGPNWFKYRIRDLKRQYSISISKPDDVLTCVNKVNRITCSDYLPIKTAHDLIEFVKNTIDTDLRRFVEDEGYYREIVQAKGHQEDLVQKTLKTQMENSFLRKGFRDADILREPQLLDGKRVDFWISYGFVGPLLIELKLTSNREIYAKSDREAYRSKLEQYVAGYGGIYCYFLILQTSEDHPLATYKPELEALYKDSTKIGLMYLCCV